MQIDDRLSTVLRTSAGSAAGERTQFRQLLDLLGTVPQLGLAPSPVLISAAYLVLGELMQAIPAEEQARILRDPGQRLRQPELAALLAQGPPKSAASAMATARLSERDWLALIPDLPITARGFLRHRRDLPPRAVQLLGQLGVRDMVLPGPAIAATREEAEAAPTITARQPAPPQPVLPTSSAQTRVAAGGPAAPLADKSVSSLLQRIEQFRKDRRTPVIAPRLPLGDLGASEAAARITRCDLRCDADGVVVWASSESAPWLVGMTLTAPYSGELVRFESERTTTAIRQHQPLRAVAPVH